MTLLECVRIAFKGRRSHEAAEGRLGRAESRASTGPPPWTMSPCPSILAVVAAMGVFLVAGQAGASWSEWPTNAVRDGIGYRSNLIDPHNPYASSERRNFGVLLARLGMIEDWTDIGGAAATPVHAAPANPHPDEAVNLEDADYTSYLHDSIAPHRLDDLFPFTPSHTGSCWVSHETTQRYIRALTSAHAPHEMRAKLVAARHRLAPGPGECLAPDSVDRYLEALRGIEGRRWRPWRDYLEGAAHFHVQNYASASSAFARIPRMDTWLGATAAYMVVRTAFWQLRDFEADRYWSDNDKDDHEAWDVHWHRLAGAIADFERIGLDWGYREDVLDLRMYAARASREPQGARTLYAAELERYLGPGREAWMPSSLFRQFSNSLTWAGAVDAASDNPLWQVNRFLAALARADRHRKSPSWRRDDEIPQPTVEATAAALSASLASGATAFDAFPGLGAYARVLLAFAMEDHGQVVASVPAETAGAEHFLPDLLLLKARSQAALGEHWEAAMTWRGIALRWSALNAVAEAGRAAVKAGRFADFASLDWDLTAEPDGRDWRSIDYDELANQYLGTHSLRNPPWSSERHADHEMAGPARFLDAKRPIHNVLREGLARFTAPERSAEIARDASLPPALRWYALEPLLRASLVGGDYQRFVELAEPTAEVNRALVDRAARWWQGPEALSRWRDMVPIASKLVQDSGDAESLMTVGYFLYSNHIYPVCNHDNATLWSRELGVCANEGPGWSRGPAPIGMFERARAIFEGRPTRDEAEGRLLRMMIHCFHTRSNRKSCLRGSEIGAEAKTRAGWFRRLHRHFPKAARKTPIWW